MSRFTYVCFYRNKTTGKMWRCNPMKVFETRDEADKDCCDKLSCLEEEGYTDVSGDVIEMEEEEL